MVPYLSHILKIVSSNMGNMQSYSTLLVHKFCFWFNITTHCFTWMFNYYMRIFKVNILKNLSSSSFYTHIQLNALKQGSKINLDYFIEMKTLYDELIHIPITSCTFPHPCIYEAMCSAINTTIKYIFHNNFLLWPLIQLN